MASNDWEKQLADLQIPAPSDSAKSEARSRALAALRSSTSGAGSGIIKFRKFHVLAAGGLAAAVTLAVLIRSEPTDNDRSDLEPTWPQIVGHDQQILNEVYQLFPDQLSAIIRDAQGMRVELTERPQAVSDQAIVVQVCHRNGQCLRIISFSGQRVETSIGNQRLTLELLVNADNEVLIAGENFVWTGGELIGERNLSFRAQALGVCI